MLTPQGMKNATVRLARVAETLEQADCNLLAARADKCLEAMRTKGASAMPVIRQELEAIDRAYDMLEALKAEDCGGDGHERDEKDERGMEASINAHAQKLFVAELRRRGYSEEDAKRMYDRMRKDRRMPDIGKGVTGSKSTRTTPGALRARRQQVLRPTQARRTPAPRRGLGIDTLL